MSCDPIIKTPNAGAVAPHLVDYAQTCANFSWQEASAALLDPSTGTLNIAELAVDRWVSAGQGQRLAMRWLGKNGECRDYSYSDLAQLSNRFADTLAQLGIGSGAVVCSLTGRIPELYISALGTWKAGAVFCPLFSAFGPEPVRTRLVNSKARVLVTTSLLYQRKVAALRDELPDLQWVLITDSDSDTPHLRAFHTLLELANPRYSIQPTQPEDAALLHFTSGSTGTPKGALHVHAAVVAHHWSGRMALDLHPEDIYWCTADPGWVTGISYGIIAPLTNGVTMLVDEAEFEVRRWYQILQQQRVNVWYTAPTAIRLLMKAGLQALQGLDFSALRFMASVGEPLNPEAVMWGLEAFGQPFHDTWWQTETGAIMVANYRTQDIYPGSMGRPLPGISAAIVQRQADNSLEFLPANTEGELAMRMAWPSMFRAYLHDAERYRECFVGDWYLSGDLATRDAAGYFWFVGRKDDVIKTAGHLVGPFEVENALMAHPAVAEVAMIGKPDEFASQIIKVFVVVKSDCVASDALRKELLGFARTRLGPAVAPRELEFVADLPKTRSGKILRRMLRARELDLPLGDLSTLERN